MGVALEHPSLWSPKRGGMTHPSVAAEIFGDADFPNSSVIRSGTLDNLRAVSVLVRLVTQGPVGACAVEDESAQTILEFRARDAWTTSWCEYDGANEPEAPLWGLATRLDVPAGEAIELMVTRGYQPERATNLVASTTLLLGERPGAFAWLGGRHEARTRASPSSGMLALARFGVSGANYPVEVWTDSDRPETTRFVAYVLGDPQALQ